MKNKKGFTLIELLAVIVVLAIIALIATPIVMNTIKNAKKGAAERTADNYIKQVETAVAEAKLENKSVPNGTYDIDGNGNLTGAGLPDGKLEINMSGNKPTSGTVTISNGEVSQNETTMVVGDYDVKYNQEKEKYEATEKGNTSVIYKNGEVVYFNVDEGTKCSSSDYTETQSSTGVKSGCMKFYAFNDDGGDTINLILDHNLSGGGSWSSGTNASGPSEVLKQLNDDTKSWAGTETPTNYTMDQTGQPTNAKYTIDYSTYKARLITAHEIAQITGNTTWDEKTATNSFYFDSKTDTASTTCKRGDTSGCSYGWLYDRTTADCTTYGCLNNAESASAGYMNGYWTASSAAVYPPINVWVVNGYASVAKAENTESLYGIRPVIEVSKSKLG